MSTKPQKTKIVFFGSFEFAVPTIEKLAQLPDFEIVAVVTNPDKIAGRKKLPSVSPAKAKALALGLKIFQPEKLRGNTTFFADLKNLNADLGLVVGYSKILPPEILTIPRLGLLNIHPSLLPKYRGPSPVPTALLFGDKITGVTIIKMDAEVDHGPIVARLELDVTPEDNFTTLIKKLFNTGAQLLVDILPDYFDNKIELKSQDHSQATFTHLLKTKDSEIKPSDTVQQTLNKIRAFNPEPGTFSMINGKRLKIVEAKPTVDLTKPILQLVDGTIELLKVQPEGGKVMSGQDWLRGHHNKQTAH